jgi:hypothetical protein
LGMGELGRAAGAANARRAEHRRDACDTGCAFPAWMARGCVRRGIERPGAEREFSLGARGGWLLWGLSWSD